MKLSVLAIILGLLFALPHVYGVAKPGAFAAWARQFPRYTPLGYVLMMMATLWFLANLKQESISDFASFKPALYTLFAAVGIGACLFVKDYLPVRGLAVLWLLLAKLMVDTARWVETEWRLVITTWAYVWVFFGMWFTISPWRLRDLINWATASERRTRLLSGMRLGFGIFIIVLGLTVYKSAESTAVAEPAPAPPALQTPSR
ncbi:MAG: hypothetical protein L0Y58_05110 [Verrucomicrobia subdivision 3 bacterium]|nr:hypothetical protein [Limisphaerales bacterium]